MNIGATTGIPNLRLEVLRLGHREAVKVSVVVIPISRTKRDLYTDLALKLLELSYWQCFRTVA